MAGIGSDKGFIEDQHSILEARIQIAEAPFILRLAHRQATVLGFFEISFGPFQLSNPRRWRALVVSRRASTVASAPDPDITSDPRVRPTGTQRVQRIHGKREVLKLNVDGFNRFGRSVFVDRRNRQHRLAVIQRLPSERLLAQLVRLDHHTQVGHSVSRRWQIVLGQDCLHAGHRQRFAHVEMFHPAMRHRTEQQLAEKHTVDPEIFGKLRLSGHFRVQIGRGIIFADQFVLLPEFLLIGLPL